ncbi:tRNA adenosine(34) deaminase TadA [Rothia aerolata]|uniref:tRNA-specific adenosine deaminase n=1 Tax=Rothia aerolata TaxID=1812262 RepID=A0A917IXT9_9MICC|nr:tRNA adenosine(34) deaminase TadA [Rothia aerolata]GGH64854.1 tRNA-specific adenosine deaminase [Rothia aerolata]
MDFPEYTRATIKAPQQAGEWMGLALAQAQRALASEDVPIGAVVLDESGQVIGTGFNRREADRDPTAHAEVLAIRQAAEHLGSWRLENCTLVVTLEPCLMCAGSILLARIPRLIFGAWEEKTGAVGSLYDVLRDRRYPHWVEVFSGVREQECAQLLKDFFREQR